MQSQECTWAMWPGNTLLFITTQTLVFPLLNLSHMKTTRIISKRSNRGSTKDKQKQSWTLERYQCCAGIIFLSSYCRMSVRLKPKTWYPAVIVLVSIYSKCSRAYTLHHGIWWWYICAKFKWASTQLLKYVLLSGRRLIPVHVHWSIPC